MSRVPRDQGEGSIELVGGALSEEDVDVLDSVIPTRISRRRRRRLRQRGAARGGGALADRRGGRRPRPEQAAGFIIREEHVRGATTVEGLEEVDGVPCLRLSAEMHAEGFEVQGSEATTTEHSELRGVMAAALPLDQEIGRLRSSEELEMRIRMRITTPVGLEGELELRYAQSERSEYRR